MLFEYALEPKAIGSSWSNARYWLEKFGFDHGRLISKFPSKWERKVLEAAREAGMGDVHYKSLVEKLRKASADAVASFGREYDHTDPSWTSNALRQHGLRSFHAIVVAEVSDSPECMLSADNDDDTHELMVSATNWEVPRVSVELAKAMTPLLQTARRVMFVDPFFDIRNSRYRATLKDCLSVVSASSNANVECEVHFRDHDSRPPAEFIERNAHTWLAGVIPVGMSIKLFVWSENRGGADFHARYLLTDRGGMNIEAGFSAEGESQRVDVTLLSRDVWSGKLDAFRRGASVYRLVEPVLKIASDGSVSRI